MAERFFARIIIILVLILTLVLFSCSSTLSQDDIKTLESYWQNDTGLYYLDMSGKNPVSFVLPSASATLSVKANILISENILIFNDAGVKYALVMNDAPSGGSTDRCMIIDSTRLCEKERP